MNEETLSMGKWFKNNLETKMEVFGGMTAIEFAAKTSWDEVYSMFYRMYGAAPNFAIPLAKREGFEAALEFIKNTVVETEHQDRCFLFTHKQYDLIEQEGIRLGILPSGSDEEAK